MSTVSAIADHQTLELVHVFEGTRNFGIALMLILIGGGSSAPAIIVTGLPNM
ncbi:MAG TPA: hypothetical protein VKB90_12140 [Candidatus Acidoferrum sp.]|nr:hypothetical protein [Candidatus Acidoferrum sp.]